MFLKIYVNTFLLYHKFFEYFDNTGFQQSDDSIEIYLNHGSFVEINFICNKITKFMLIIDFPSILILNLIFPNVFKIVRIYQNFPKA